MSLWGAGMSRGSWHYYLWCCCVHEGWCVAFVLLGSGNGLFCSGVTSIIGVDGPGLAGCTASQITFLFLVYLAPKLVWTWWALGFCLLASQWLLLFSRLAVQDPTVCKSVCSVETLGVVVPCSHSSHPTSASAAPCSPCSHSTVWTGVAWVVAMPAFVPGQCFSWTEISWSSWSGSIGWHCKMCILSCLISPAHNLLHDLYHWLNEPIWLWVSWHRV